MPLSLPIPFPPPLPPLSEAASLLGRLPLARLDRLLEPRVGGRLAGLSGVVLICPTDAPLALAMTLSQDRPLSSRLVTQQALPPADAVIRAPITVLWALTFGGGLDGDGSFFNRALLMEGDTALAMALRYALEEADLTPEEVLAELAPLPRRLARSMADRLVRRGHRVAQTVEEVQDRLLEPLTRRVARLEREVGGMAETVAGLAARSRRLSARDGGVE